MPAQLITINDTQIERLSYRDQPVVTFQQIAEVHGISVKNVQKSFQDHRERFTEGKHHFKLDFTEASSLPLKGGANSNGITVFTEKGYLLLVKPLGDDVAWRVQECMIDEYFALRTTPQRKTRTPKPLSPAQRAMLQAKIDRWHELIVNAKLKLGDIPEAVETLPAPPQQITGIQWTFKSEKPEMSAADELLFGKLAAKKSRELGRSVSKAADRRWRNDDGSWKLINAYDEDILEMVYAEHFAR